MTRPAILPMGVEQAEALASEVNNPTADRGGCAARSSVGFLEPGRESETSPIGTSRTRDVVGFPRASSAPGSYAEAYRRDCRPLMLKWLAQNAKLSDFDDAFGLSPDTEQDALTIATECATVELGRGLNANEGRLLANCVRDWAIAKTALRLAAELRGVVGLLPSGQSGPNRHLAASASCDLADLAERVERGEE